MDGRVALQISHGRLPQVSHLLGEEPSHPLSTPCDPFCKVSSLAGTSSISHEPGISCSRIVLPFFYDIPHNNKRQSAIAAKSQGNRTPRYQHQPSTSIASAPSPLTSLCFLFPLSAVFVGATVSSFSSSSTFSPSSAISSNSSSSSTSCT